MSDVDLAATLDPVLREHYPAMQMRARHANHGGLAVIEILIGGDPLCWIDGDVLQLIAVGDDDALEIVTDEIDHALAQRARRATRRS